VIKVWLVMQAHELNSHGRTPQLSQVPPETAPQKAYVAHLARQRELQGKLARVANENVARLSLGRIVAPDPGRYP
jgi:hypothetical protein